MGTQTAAGILAGMSAAAEAGAAVSQVGAAESKTQMLNLQSKQIKLQTQQKTLSNYDLLNKTLESQEALQTTRGTSFSSPSFNAIKRDTLNKGSKNQKNIDIEGDIAQENIKLEKQNVKKSLFAQLFGDVAQTATMGFSYQKALPTLKD